MNKCQGIDPSPKNVRKTLDFLTFLSISRILKWLSDILTRNRREVPFWINNLDFASNRSESALRASNLYQRNDTFTRRPYFGIQVNHVFRQSECRINYIEHVVVTTRIVHPRRGDLEISVVSPQGTKSSLLDTRWRDKVCFALYCLKPSTATSSL